MAADLHIHVFEGISEDDLAEFFACTLGSKHFNPRRGQGEAWSKACHKISETPNIWIGEVSWLKAAISGDDETYIPDTVDAIHECIGEDLPILTDELIEKILKAFDPPNKTGYSLNSREKVQKFLEAHKGKKVFTVSW